MKNIIVIILSLMLVICLCSCGEGPEDTTTETEAETEEDTRTYQEMPYDDLDYEKLEEYVQKIYDHPDTTKTPLALTQSVDTESLNEWGTVKKFGGVVQYYDSAYELKPVEYNNKTVMYKPPYVRYDLNGYPAYATPGDYVIHIDICEVPDVYICGINVRSSFEDFEKAFTGLGFTVAESTEHTSYGERRCIKAEIDGLWIILEQESELKLQKGIYDYKKVIEYENNTVPAILRMGVAVNHYSRVEQFILP